MKVLEKLHSCHSDSESPDLDLLVPEPNKKIDSLKSAVDGIHSSLIRIIQSGNTIKSLMNSSLLLQ